MLNSIHVKNLALIDDCNVEFGNGLNIISGETGAGKSLLIKSVELALGKKGDKSLIRNGKEFALVELEFSNISDFVKKILNENDIECEDGDSLIISRKISDTKSIARINGETCTLKVLSNITSKLLALHGQESAFEFRNEDYHLELLDLYGDNDLKQSISDVKCAYENYVNLKNKYYELKTKFSNPNFNKEFLEFEVSELESANLSVGEDEELEQKFKLINESKNVMEILSQALLMLSGDLSIKDSLGEVTYALSKYKDMDSEIKEVYDNLSNMEELANDTSKILNNYIDSLDFDEKEKVEIEERLDILNSLKNKHNTDIEGLINLLESKKDTLNKIDNIDEELKKVKESFDNSLLEYNKKSEILSCKRKEVAKEFIKNIIKEMQDLEFSKIEMCFDFKERSEPTVLGKDIVSILVSFNSGEHVKPLVEVASGGELSRVMLAVKSSLGNKENIDTLIFDEIDSGISGISADKVGQKMREISKNHQVLSITHLAGIVALGDNNYLISKEDTGSVTTTNVRKLREEETILEVGRILGGSNISESVLKTARELRGKK